MNEYAKMATIAETRIPIHTRMGSIVAAIANTMIAGHMLIIPSMIYSFLTFVNSSNIL